MNLETNCYGPVPGPATAEAWPIAASLMHLPRILPDGTRATDASPEEWSRQLEPVVRAGFTHIEVPGTWVRLGDLPPGRLIDFSQVLDHLGLTASGAIVDRESVIHAERGRMNLAFSHRMVDAAAALGVPIVCLGLHDDLLPVQRDHLWFWTVAGSQKSPDPEVYSMAVAAYRELGKHASGVGTAISLELYEDTYLGSGRDAVRFVCDIDEPAVGLNPDLGNLIRRQGPIEPWQSVLEATIPYANYWHVKNYQRLEDPGAKIVLTAPATMENGIINYREAMATALNAGFSGPFVVEHYGGDSLSVAATNCRYLRLVLEAVLGTPRLVQ